MDHTAKCDCVLTSEFVQATAWFDDELTWDAVIAAKDIRKLPSRPNLYVLTSSDGKPCLRTQERRNASPTWHDTRPLCVFTLSMLISLNAGLILLAYRSVSPRSVLSFRLKQCTTLWRDSSLGSVDIKAEELLDRCKHGEGTSH
jgi:hypothetical protein